MLVLFMLVSYSISITYLMDVRITIMYQLTQRKENIATIRPGHVITKLQVLLYTQFNVL